MQHSLTIVAHECEESCLIHNCSIGPQHSGRKSPDQIPLLGSSAITAVYVQVDDFTLCFRTELGHEAELILGGADW